MSKRVVWVRLVWVAFTTSTSGFCAVLWLLRVLFPESDSYAVVIVAAILMGANIGLGIAAIVLQRLRLAHLFTAFVVLLLLGNYVGYRIDLEHRPKLLIPASEGS